ncbi:MAG: glycosyltransferase [Pseudoflavonifractor sp.]|nr:glycosyltransferase [Pseudoflavonifractor sp.]
MNHRILIVNKFYYPRGGDCVCTINLERLLRDKGHETAVYSMEYPENIETEWSRYFAPAVDFGGGVRQKVDAVKRILGFGDIRKSFARILSDFNPDIVHLNNIHSYLSPELAVMARRHGARVVWTLHDYKLICPSYNCLYDDKPCEDCFSHKFSVVSKRCMKGSLAASAIAFVEALRWNRRVLEKNVDMFICPSGFMRDKMAQAGFSPDKLAVDCNFVDFDKLERFVNSPVIDRDDYYCYVGRLSVEKGVGLMLEVASSVPYRIKIAGDGPMAEQLREKYRDCENIEFLGRQDAVQVSGLLSKARFSIIPSMWYENNPLGVIESLCAGTPVVGARIGGIPELIDEGKTGLTFESGDAESMRDAVTKAFEMDWDNEVIKEVSFARFSADRHYEILEKIYNTHK